MKLPNVHSFTIREKGVVMVTSKSSVRCCWFRHLFVNWSHAKHIRSPQKRKSSSGHQHTITDHRLKRVFVQTFARLSTVSIVGWKSLYLPTAGPIWWKMEWVVQWSQRSVAHVNDRPNLIHKGAGENAYYIPFGCVLSTSPPHPLTSSCRFLSL